MSTNISEAGPTVSPASAAAPKRITNAQTVCNERNEKNKLCNGHLKQLRTAGEASEVHLRGDDVLSKCSLCGTLYMGPPLGHVRDPEKQSRFVEAELTALLQAAGGTLPVIEKNDKGVYVIVEPGGAGHGHALPAAKAAPAVATPAAVPAKPTPAAAQATAVVEKASAAPAGPKPAAQPDRQLNRRTTYAGVVDIGPVAGETKDQKIERLQKLVAGAKQRSDEGGAEATAAVTVVDSSPAADLHRPAAEAQAETGAASAAPLSAATANASPVAGAESAADLAPDTVAPATTPTPTSSHAPSGEADRTLMKRSAYAGVLDTGPISGETHEQKIERLTKLAAAAKQKADEGG
ncbi:MAG: hypothetical protein QOE96_487 [Blastocatellia bacterium]|jgi:hypothetical protein|nr:hypothetical protein [Blastocatellia bacterium]